MNIENIILIQRDTGYEFQLVGLKENGLCYLHGITTKTRITLNLFHVLNALNTPNGAWNLKGQKEL